MKTILLLSPYWKEPHRWMVSSFKMAELWQRLGYKVVVLCMGEKSGTEIVSPTLTIHRMKDVFLPDPWNYGIAIGFAGRARRLANELKPDVIVVNKILFWSSIALIRLRLAGHRVLLTSDTLVGITWWPRGKIAQVCAAIYAWTLGWLILQSASRIVFFHPQPENVLRRLRIQKKVQVIPTGIDTASFAPSPSKLAARSSQLTVTYTGRLESVKGVDDFIVAALKVKQDHPELAINVVGWYKDNHALVNRYEHQVHFTGLRNDIPAILSTSDIFVLPSHSEGLSNALMEAMASSCACIASDVGGNRYVLQNGVSGFLFPPGDRDALASHIRRLLEDPAKRLAVGQAARERMEKEFSWDVVGKKYRDLFDKW